MMVDTSTGGTRPLWRLGGIFVLLAVALALPFLFWGEQFDSALDRGEVLAWFADYRSYAWILAIGLLVSDLLLPIPNTVIMAALGALYGPFLGGVAAVVGNCLSGLLGYGLGRRFGRPLAIRLVGAAELAQTESLFARSGGWAVALSRWAPIVPEVICCMAGLARMRFSLFLLSLFCGAAPLGFTVAAIGYAGSDRPLATLALCALLPVPLWLGLQVVVRRRGRGPLWIAGGQTWNS